MDATVVSSWSSSSSRYRSAITSAKIRTSIIVLERSPDRLDGRDRSVARSVLIERLGARPGVCGTDDAHGVVHPYFFVDTTGVQLLFSGLEIQGSGTLIVYSALVAALCLADRFAAAKAAALKGNRERELAAVGWWTAQRCSGGLVMLVMMSFNLVLFLETVVFLGVSELLMVRTSAAGGAQQAYAPVSQGDDEAG